MNWGLTRVLLLLGLIAAPAHAQVLSLDPPRGAAVTVPSPSAGAIVYQDGMISLFGGLVTLHVPADWQREDRKDAHFGIRPSYHPALNARDRPECRGVVQLMQITNGATQAYANARFMQVKSQVEAETRADGSLVAYSKQPYPGGVIMEQLSTSNSYAYTETRQFMLVHERDMIVVHVDCSITLPEIARDKADIESFLDSITIHRPS